MLMVRRSLLIFAFALIAGVADPPAHALAQSEAADEVQKELETDRDAFTPATSVAGQGVTILESSYSFVDNRSVAETHSFPETLIRYGISEWIELRFGWNYEVGGAGNVVSGNEGGEVEEVAGEGLERETQFLYGLKFALTGQQAWVPRSVVILQGYTPTRGESPATDLSLAYAFGWELPNRCRLESSIRYATDHDRQDALNLWAPSAIFRVPLTEKWNVHAECFGIYSQGAEADFSHGFFSPGSHYLVTPNLELGVRVGWGITDDAPQFFSNVGVGWRF